MDDEPAPGPLTNVDRALILAAKVWGDQAGSGVLDRFPIDRRASLRWGWEAGGSSDRSSALESLRREHAAQARPDPARVHMSWWVRALEEEVESVRRAVLANLPAAIADALRVELKRSPEDLRGDRPAHPLALETALALWTVRIVGGLAERPDDPPVVVALTRFDTRTAARLIQTTGLAKWSLTDRPMPPLERNDAERLAHFREAFVGADPRFVQVATRDVDTLTPGGPHPLARAGLTGFARLLNAADRHRVRWALQHLPYGTAKTLRTQMGAAGKRAPMLARWETDVLRAAWVRLHDEGFVPDGWGGTP